MSGRFLGHPCIDSCDVMYEWPLKSVGLLFYSDNYTVVEKGNFASALTGAARLSTPKKKIILEVKFDPKFWNLKQQTLKEQEITQ